MMKQQYYIYIAEYSQYWFQNAVLNLITTRRECTLLQYSTTLSSIIASFCIIFDICNMMQLPFYIYSSILPVLISKCCIEFIHYKTWITLFQCSKTLSSIITSFWIIFNICYMMKQQYYIYIAEYSQYWFQNAVLNLITTRRECTLLQYSTTLSSIITSFWIIFNICYMMKQQYYIYIAEYSHYWFQNAVLNLITTRRECTLLQYSTTLSSIIASFCIIFDICNMMQLSFYIYSRILPVLISKCCIEFKYYKTWMHSNTVF